METTFYILSALMSVAGLGFGGFAIYETRIKKVSGEVCEKRMRFCICALIVLLPVWFGLVSYLLRHAA